MGVCHIVEMLPNCTQNITWLFIRTHLGSLSSYSLLDTCASGSLPWIWLCSSVLSCLRNVGSQKWLNCFLWFFCIKLVSHKVTKVERSNQNVDCNISQNRWDVKLKFFMWLDIHRSHKIIQSFQVGVGEHAWTCPKLCQIISWLLYIKNELSCNACFFFKKKGTHRSHTNM